MEKIKTVKTICEDLKKYSYLAKEGDYINVTEWANGDGWDVDINGQTVHLTDGDLRAINYLTAVLEYEK